ncbi:hypothetical protein MSI_00060 [Treponema sp. JC4]|nr:hypothetical protein MSI_00060 [Treponema sp. JC4]
MKKLIRGLAASFLLVSLFAACATTSAVDNEAAEKNREN